MHSPWRSGYAPLPNNFETTPFCHIPVIKRLRNLGRIQFIAKSSTKHSLRHKHKTFWSSWRNSPIQLSSQTLCVIIENKKLLQKISSKNLTAWVLCFTSQSPISLVGTLQNKNMISTFCLIWFCKSQSTLFRSSQDGSSWVEQVLRRR